MAIASRLLEDVFQASGLTPSDEMRDPSVVSIVLVTTSTLAWTLFSTAWLTGYLARRGFNIRSAFSLWRSTELIVIETVRAIAATLLRLPLLLVPGLVEWIRLTPIPFIVILDSGYQAGDRDALQSARTLFSNHKLRVLLLLIPTTAIFLAEFVITSSPTDVLPIWSAPIQHVGSILIFSILRLGSDTFVLSQYRAMIRPAALTDLPPSGSNGS